MSTLNKDILTYLYNGLTRYDHALIGKIRQTCKAFSYYPPGVLRVKRGENVTRYVLLMNDEEFYHRDGGPAIELVTGGKQWFVRGKRHREDGPAVEYVDGYKEWWVHGERYRENGTAFVRECG